MRGRLPNHHQPKQTWVQEKPGAAKAPRKKAGVAGVEFEAFNAEALAALAAEAKGVPVGEPKPPNDEAGTVENTLAVARANVCFLVCS
jgi:hypothetical protein